MYNQPSSPVPESVKNLIQEYDELYGRFTYAHPDNPEKYNGLQVGLVAIFYLDKSWDKRQAIADVLGDFHHHFGEHLKYGYFNTRPNEIERFDRLPLATRQKEIVDIEPESDITLTWGDNPSYKYVNNYQIKLFSIQKWKEELYKDVSYLKLYLPIDILEEKGLPFFETFIKETAEKLQPIHGVVGLGIQQTNEAEEYQHIEYKMARDFRGLDVSNVDFDGRYRNGFKSINWLMILSDELIHQKLGSQSELEAKNTDKSILFHPYQGGVIVQAGEVPALGYVNHDPNPVHYVSANKLLKPARAPEIGALGYRPVMGEKRFNENSTTSWQSRFDNVEVTDSALSLSTPKN